MNSSNCKFSSKAGHSVGNFMGLSAPTIKVVAMVGNSARGSSGDSSNGATLKATEQLKAAARLVSYL